MRNVVYFFVLGLGADKWLMILIKQLNFENLKNGQFKFFLHFATTTHCIFKFWQINPPYCTVQYVTDDANAKHFVRQIFL